MLGYACMRPTATCAECGVVVRQAAARLVRQVPLGTDTPLVSKTHHFRSRFSPPPQHRKLEF
jgi:hypothetical protein